MACYDTYPYTCTYDSNAGAGKDYSDLATWEAASDNDLSGTGITTLDCYDSQQHEDGNVTIADATNTDETHFRRIRSSPNCSTPFAGTRTTGAQFVQTASAERYGIVLYETHARIEQLSWKKTSNNIYSISCIDLLADDCKAINCIVYDCENANASAWIRGFDAQANNNLILQCIADNNENDGFYINVGSGETSGFVCCTSVNNSAYGFNSGLYTGMAIVWSCYGANNSSSDYRNNASYWTQNGSNYWSGWNSSKDTSSDLGTGAGDNYKNSNDLITGGELDSNLLPTESIDWSGGAGDNAGRSPIDDISGNWNPESFFTTDPLAGYDIAGNARPSGTDAAWDVGAGEYVAAGGAGLLIMAADKMGNKNMQRGNKQ